MDTEDDWNATDDDTLVELIRDGIAQGWWDPHSARISQRARRQSWWSAAIAQPTEVGWKRRPETVSEQDWDFAYMLEDIERMEGWKPGRLAELTRLATK